MRHIAAATLLSLTLGVQPLCAQLVPDGATNTLVNFTNTFTGTVTVGTNGAFTLLVLSNNVLVTNTTGGVIGANATARSNEVRLVSPTARWRMGGTLMVGSSGERNRLVVSNGALVTANRGSVGDSSSHNQAEVSGPGSIWSNVLSFVAGFSGHSNRMVVNSGGVLNNTVGAIGDSGHGNEVAVTGTGSLWENRRDLTIGSVGIGNRLLLSDGGRVVSSNAFIGLESAGNLAVINGVGSVWSNRFELTVGNSGGGNQLAVTNGGGVTSSNAYIGRAVGALGNAALVSGPGSFWTNSAGLFIGGPGNGGRLEVRAGGTVSTGRGLLGATNSTLNSLLVADSGSKFLAMTELLVGQSGSPSSLVVSNGGWVLSSTSYVGYARSASNNSAFISGAGSVWSNRSDLTVGSNSPGNRVEVRDGGRVVVNDAVRVGRHAQSVSNLILVTDPGSVWSNAPGSTFELGSFGSSNRLFVSSGGRIQLPSVLVGGTSTSEGNEAFLTGAGTVGDMDFLILGNLGPRNRVQVRSGAALLTTGSALGFSDLARNNEALIADPGSLWAAERLIVGFQGGGSQLVLSNGGTVVCPQLDVPEDRPEHGLVMGELGSSTNNRVVVNGGVLRIANGDGTAALDVRRGTNVFSAGLIDVDVLLLTNTLGHFEFNGGTLVTRSAVISNNTTFTIGNVGSTPAVWDVRSGPKSHHVARAMFLGFDAPFAHLVHTNGALLTNSDFTFVGVDQSSRSNRITLAGPSSRWEMAGGIYVGDTSSDNRLTVTEGATLYSGKRIILGNDLSSDNNEAVISGSGSSWTTASDVPMLIGSSGSSNRFILASTGQAAHGIGILGFRSSGSNNLALITGAGSRWNILDELRVGGESAGNHLIISNGAVLFTGGLGILGADTNASRNSAIVTGPGSQWLLHSNLFVGSNASLSTLVISNGGLIASPDGGLGIRPASSNNLAVVTGAGSQWKVEETLQIGRSGPNNLMQVLDGASVSTRNTSLGQGSGSSGNSMLVRGPGSIWTNLEEIVVGIAGSGNRLVVEAGARMESGIGTLGDGIDSVGNEVVVSGTGSLWRSSGQIVVGQSGGQNQLIVTNGGVVISSSGALSGNSVARSNVVVVTGPGSMWSNSASLAINQGSGNQLVISDGGLVRSISGLVGVGSNASNSTALVTGPGSEWINEFNLDVAQSGPGHHLVISNGGSVRVGGGLSLGSGNNTTNSRIVIDGGTLRSTNSQGTGPFDIRRGTNLLNAGLVEADRLFLTNSQGFFEFNGGTVISGNSVIANGQPFRVGNGVSPATFQLRGNGTHDFALDGLSVSAKGALTGSGNVAGELVIQPGGLLSPGAPLGRLSLTLAAPPTLLGTTLMEISRTGGVTSNDVIQTTSSFVYGGAILVTNHGPDALAPGNRFRLFEASGFSGSLSNLVLPPLGAGLAWRTNLLVDGSIDVVSLAPPGFSGVLLAGTNVVIAGTNGPANGSYTVLSSTNVALPLSNWVSIATNVFDANGAFSFTNAFDPGIPQRFFRLLTP